MKDLIVVAGATGNLGGKIVNELLAKDAAVTAIVRKQTDLNKVNILKDKGVQVVEADFENKRQLSNYCVGAKCIVSALSGLKETILDAQKNLLDAAVDANVQRFIPSDFCIDFTNLKVGKNRNLDLRRTFHQYLDKAPLKATTIFNGAFMDLLTTDMPLILFKQKRVLCWGSRNQKMEFTTSGDVAEYTAMVALDDHTPRYLRIAGDTFSCNDFVTLLTVLSGNTFKIFRPGGIGLLNEIIKVAKFVSPSKNQLYPAWQGMQYMRDMMEGRIEFQTYNNNRYKEVKWTSIQEFLKRSKVIGV